MAAELQVVVIFLKSFKKKDESKKKSIKAVFKLKIYNQFDMCSLSQISDFEHQTYCHFCRLT